MAAQKGKASAKAPAKKTSKNSSVKKTAAKTVAKTVAKKAPAKVPAKVSAARSVPPKKIAAPAKSAPAAAPATKTPKNYDESQIKHLDASEHIRLRSGMYIGRLGDGSNQNDGIYVLLKEVIDNSIDEFIMGYGKKIDIAVKDSRVKVRDYGRGIPLGKVVDCVSELNTGAKYTDDVFQFSVGMNGVGTKAVNALSSYFRVVSVRDGECAEAIFEKGKLIKQRKGKLKEKQANGTFFEFVPDEEIFGKYTFNMEFVENHATTTVAYVVYLTGSKKRRLMPH